MRATSGKVADPVEVEDDYDGYDEEQPPPSSRRAYAITADWYCLWASLRKRRCRACDHPFHDARSGEHSGLRLHPPSGHGSSWERASTDSY